MNLLRRVALGLVVFSAFLAVGGVIFSPSRSEAGQEKSEPWSSAEVLRAEELAHQVGQKSANAPTIIYVGFRTLFEGGHVPGAKFCGTASTEKGLADLKSAVTGLPRSTEMMIYCGCCPFEKCPNIRPAYKALHALGFTHLRVLVLPTSFAADWVEKGYPIEKGLS